MEPEVGNDSVYLEIDVEQETLARVSNWSVVNTDTALNVHIHSINLWWETIEAPEEYCIWTFVFYVNGENIMEYAGNCLTDGNKVERETFIIDDSVGLLVGDTFEVEIFYEGTEDFYFFFNSEEFDTGLDVTFSIP